MIYGQRVRLRSPEREDIPRFVAWLNDPEVRSGLSLYLPLSLVEEEQWFEDMVKSPAPERPMVIEIEDNGGWTAVGNCGFLPIDWRNRSGEVGIFIGEKSYWNKGFGTEVMRLLLKHGFDTLNLHRIGLRVYENNRGAIRSYEKAGFQNEGCLREAEYQEGKYLDIYLMSVLRSEWENIHAE